MPKQPQVQAQAQASTSSTSAEETPLRDLLKSRLGAVNASARTSFIIVRVTKDEHARVREVAAALGLPLSELIRHLLLKLLFATDGGEMQAQLISTALAEESKNYDEKFSEALRNRLVKRFESVRDKYRVSSDGDHGGPLASVIVDGDFGGDECEVEGSGDYEQA